MALSPVIHRLPPAAAHPSAHDRGGQHPADSTLAAAACKTICTPRADHFARHALPRGLPLLGSAGAMRRRSFHRRPLHRRGMAAPLRAARSSRSRPRRAAAIVPAEAGPAAQIRCGSAFGGPGFGEQRKAGRQEPAGRRHALHFNHPPPVPGLRPGENRQGIHRTTPLTRRAGRVDRVTSKAIVPARHAAAACSAPSAVVRSWLAGD